MAPLKVLFPLSHFDTSVFGRTQTYGCIPPERIQTFRDDGQKLWSAIGTPLANSIFKGSKRFGTPRASCGVAFWRVDASQNGAVWTRGHRTPYSLAFSPTGEL
jgi:hypothetical protein